MTGITYTQLKHNMDMLLSTRTILYMVTKPTAMFHVEAILYV